MYIIGATYPFGTTRMPAFRSTVKTETLIEYSDLTKDDTATAIYLVGAALAERLEMLIGRLDNLRDR